jgi:ArsR family transcriptional regulator, zinc-responsive transcriptional repressor
MRRINLGIISFFGALADETRLRMLVSISERPKTVGEIHAAVPDLSLSAVSHQLSYMANLKMLESQKKGRSKYFRLSHKFCWCMLRDAFSSYGHSCSRCADIEAQGGILPRRK